MKREGEDRMMEEEEGGWGLRAEFQKSEREREREQVLILGCEWKGKRRGWDETAKAACVWGWKSKEGH